jgi:hypothetical protein
VLAGCVVSPTWRRADWRQRRRRTDGGAYSGLWRQDERTGGGGRLAGGPLTPPLAGGVVHKGELGGRTGEVNRRHLEGGGGGLAPE